MKYYPYIQNQESESGPTVIIPTIEDWYDVHSNVTVGTGTVEKTGSNSWANSASFGTVPEGKNCELQWNLKSNSAIGLVGLDIDSLVNWPDWSFYYNYTAGRCYVYEKGVNKKTLTNFNTSMVFKIQRESGVFTFYINDVLQYTSENEYNGPLEVDTICYHLSFGAYNIKLTYY